MPSETHIKKLVQFVSEVEFEDLPQQVVQRAKVAVMDFFGNCLGALGTSHELIEALLALTEETASRPESTVLGLSRKVSAMDAAMAQGVLGNFLDFSDGHYLGGHINDRVVPASLAVAEKIDASGKEFITAVALGYEVYIRLAYALFEDGQPASSKAPLFVVLGPMAGAVAAGRLLGLTCDQMLGAMGLSASMQISAGQYTVSGGHEKDLSPGHESRRAVFSAMMAQKRVLGSKDILDGVRGLGRTVRRIELGRLTEGLGEDFKIRECYLKPYPACRYLHASIDAAIDIVRNHHVDPVDIREVKVITNSESATRSTKEILSHVCAIFSHQYQVSVVLAEGKPDLPVFWRRKMEGGVVGEIMRKTNVSSTEEFDALYRARTLDLGTWPSRVAVLTGKSVSYESTVLRPKGDPTNPMTEQEIETKFRTNASKILSMEETSKLMSRLLEIERTANVREVCEDLAGQIKRWKNTQGSWK